MTLLHAEQMQEELSCSLTNLPKDLLIHSKGKVQHVFDVIVLHPLQALVELLVQEL